MEIFVVVVVSGPGVHHPLLFRFRLCLDPVLFVHLVDLDLSRRVGFVGLVLSRRADLSRCVGFVGLVLSRRVHLALRSILHVVHLLSLR